MNHITVLPNWWLVAGAVVMALVVVACDGPAAVRRRRPGRLLLHLLLASLVAAVALRPGIEGGTATRRTMRADVLLVIDRSASMGAVDHRGGTPRMDGVVEDVTSLVRRFEGARVAVLTFDNDARLEVPSTTDLDSVTTAVRAMGWRENDAGTGADVSIGIPLATKVLEQMRRADPAAARYLYVLSDGEQTARATPASFAALRPLVTEAHVVAYGSTEGAQVRRSRTDHRPVMYRGRPAESVCDVTAMKRIAGQLGADLTHDAPAPGPVHQPPLLVEPQDGPGRREWYPYLAVVCALAVLVDLAGSTRRWALARQEARHDD